MVGMSCVPENVPLKVNVTYENVEAEVSKDRRYWVLKLRVEVTVPLTPWQSAGLRRDGNRRHENDRAAALLDEHRRPMLIFLLKPRDDPS